MPCNICGREVKTREVSLEGAFVEVCYSCVPKGKEDRKKGAKESEFRPRKRVRETEIVEDFAERLREALKGIDIKEFARKLGISEGFLRNIEKGKMKPDLKTARKLEKELGIKLTEEIEVELSERRVERKKELTLEEQAVWE